MKPPTEPSRVWLHERPPKKWHINPTDLADHYNVLSFYGETETHIKAEAGLEIKIKALPGFEGKNPMAYCTGREKVAEYMALDSYAVHFPNLFVCDRSAFEGIVQGDVLGSDRIEFSADHICESAPNISLMGWRSRAKMLRKLLFRSSAPPVPSRTSVALVDALEKRAAKSKESAMEAARDEALRSAYCERRLMQSLMEDGWLGLRVLLQVASKGAQGLSDIVAAVGAELDAVGAVSSELVTFGGLAVSEKRYVCTDEGTRIAKRTHQLAK